MKVRIGNCDYLSWKGKNTTNTTSFVRSKFITYVMYVPDLDRNLISAG